MHKNLLAVIGVLVLPLTAASGAAGEAIVPTPDPVEDEYIVTLEQDVARLPDQPVTAGPSVAEIAAELARTHRGEVLHVYRHALQGFSIRLPEQAALGLSRDPRVQRVEQNGRVRAGGTQSNPPWGLDRIDDRDLPLDGTYVFSNSATSVHVFVLDTGLRTTHQEFSGRVGAGFTAINDGRGVSDCHGHGTHVAGTVGGTTYGVSKGVTIHPVRVLDCDGYGTWSEVIAGVDWVTANDHLQPGVANMSLWGGANSSVDDAVKNSIFAGFSYSVIAGNDDDNACNYSPARVDQAITVGSTTSSDSRSSFSNFGTCVDIFAPGSSITSAWNGSDTDTATASGTSMASPHVAGVAALLMHAHPSKEGTAVNRAIGCDSTKGRLSNIGSGSPNRLVFSRIDIDDPPDVSFGHICSGLDCTFVSGSCDDIGIQSYAWDFGDGTTGSGSTVSHTYSFGGSYTVTLTVTDSAGQSGQESQVVEVSDPTEDCPSCPTCRICPDIN